MRIAFDTAPLVRPYPPGVVRATRGLLEGLREHTALEVLELAPGKGEGERWWRQRKLPRQAAAAACAGIHSPVSAFAWRGPGRRVQTMHELPWRHDAHENSGLTHRFWARFGPSRADAVICPTEIVRRDLQAESPRAKAKLFACPWGLGQAFADVRQGNREPDSHGRPFALAVGAVRRKKNLAACLRALACGTPPLGDELDLVVTGPPTEDLDADLELARALGLEQRVRVAGNIADSELADLMAHAACVVVLSRSEGFGFPVLEALACGTPVVVSAGSAQAEVAGSEGIVVDPDDSLAVAAAFRRALGEPEEACTQRRTRAAEFTWRRCARQVEELWRRWE
jgi:glycosyltransferase involved in cell wall biosynthesis